MYSTSNEIASKRKKLSTNTPASVAMDKTVGKVGAKDGTTDGAREILGKAVGARDGAAEGEDSTVGLLLI